MKIKIGKYYLCTDKWNYWIDEEYEIEKGKNKGETGNRSLTGYCWTFERCLQTFRERTLGQSEATTLLELLEALKSVYGSMDALDKEALEHGLKRIEAIDGREELQ